MSSHVVKAPSKKRRGQAMAGRVRVTVVADINITAPIARRLVNIELMKKVGQMILAGEPELVIEGQQVFWKVPLLVVPLDDDPKSYPTGRYAWVDAIKGLYTMTEQERDALKTVSDPILDRLYPDLTEWLEKVREVKAR